jgi:hypothetical protein
MLDCLGIAPRLDLIGYETVGLSLGGLPIGSSDSLERHDLDLDSLTEFAKISQNQIFSVEKKQILLNFLYHYIERHLQIRYDFLLELI